MVAKYKPVQFSSVMNVDDDTMVLFSFVLAFQNILNHLQRTIIYTGIKVVNHWCHGLNELNQLSRELNNIECKVNLVKKN